MLKLFFIDFTFRDAPYFELQAQKIVSSNNDCSKENSRIFYWNKMFLTLSDTYFDVPL